MKASARFFLFFSFLLLLAFSIFRVPAFAQENSADSGVVMPEASDNLGTDADVPQSLHNGTQILMIESMAGVLCQLTGVDYTHPNQKCLGVDPQTGKIGFTGNGGGAIAAMGTVIGYTMTPPASSTQYMAYLKGHFGPIQKTYAATTDPCDQPTGLNSRGVGFCGLWPIIDLWIAMRNIVYLIFILVFVVVGLGIMLRLHIDPQTVMTIQNQIPKIIIGIIAITFSFAIAGLLIDIMWVATYLFASVITGAAGGSPDFNNIILATNPFNAAANLPGGIAGVSATTANAFGQVVSNMFNGPAQNFNHGDIIMGAIGGFLNLVISLLGFLIIAIALLIALLRLWITLIFTYVQIILDVVFAPFWILAGVIPGSPLSLGAWIRDLVANLSVFPMTIGFFLLADVFMTTFNTSNVHGRFVPPLTGGVDGGAISALIGLGFLLMLPNMLTTMKAALKAPKIDLGPIFGPLTSAGKGLRAGVGAYATASSSGQEELQQTGIRRVLTKHL